MHSLNNTIQKITIAGGLMLACTLSSWSQNAGNKSYLDLELQYFQNKDLRNYGLVFSGGNLAVGYTREMQLKNAPLTYQAEFGLGPGFSKGIASLNWHLKPLYLDLCFPISNNEDFKFYLGPYLAMNYYLQLYPELQSGHAMWFTFYDMGPKIKIDTRIREQEFSVSLVASLVGLVSRPAELNETYYYDLGFTDLMRKLHSNFTAGSVNSINHIDFELRWKDLGKGNNSLSYKFEYFGYNNEPELKYLAHSLCFSIKLGGKQK